MMKHIFPLGLVTLGVLLSIGALGQLYLNGRGNSPATIDLPKEVAGLHSTESRSGDQAISEFMGLHGKEFPINSGAGAPSESIALEMTNAMQQRITEGNSPFTPVSEMRDRNREVYALEGVGQKHYYFQSKNLVIWLDVDPALSEEALQQTLEVYP